MNYASCDLCGGERETTEKPEIFLLLLFSLLDCSAVVSFIRLMAADDLLALRAAVKRAVVQRQFESSKL